MVFLRFALTSSLLLWLTTFGAAASAEMLPDCLSNKLSSPCLGQTFSRSHHGSVFTWEFSCDGGDCQFGRFNNGEYWVTHPNGDKVTILSALPSGSQDGLEANPSDPLSQGLLACSANYKTAKNLQSQLPLDISPNTSLVKTEAQLSGCGAPSIEDCCVKNYDTLTVLDTPPLANGAQTFRPGPAGNVKRLFTEADVDYTRIPAYEEVSNSTVQVDFADIIDTWSGTYVDHFMVSLGDQGRAFWPHGMGSIDYGAAQAENYGQALLSVMGTDLSAEKRPAVNALFQRGLDLYTSWSNGVTWPSGAGQQLGRKPPITFFGAMVLDQEIRDQIKNMPVTDTQEDSQVRRFSGENKVAVWGDYPGTHSTNASCSTEHYWAQVLHRDNKRTCADPYGFIDGPAGNPGTAYMQCCSSGPLVAYALQMWMMSDMCEVGSNEVLLDYADRIYDPIRKTGVHTLPDPCAPPDPRESQACKTHLKGAPGCIYYGETWGEDPENAGQCIHNNSGENTGQNGRHPDRNGADISNNLSYMPALVPRLWSSFRGNKTTCTEGTTGSKNSLPNAPQLKVR